MGDVIPSPNGGVRGPTTFPVLKSGRIDARGYTRVERRSGLPRQWGRRRLFSSLDEFEWVTEASGRAFGGEGNIIYHGGWRWRSFGGFIARRSFLEALLPLAVGLMDPLYEYTAGTGSTGVTIDGRVGTDIPVIPRDSVRRSYCVEC